MRILIVANQSLLGDVLENLFSGLSATCIKRVKSADPEAVLQRVARYQPEIIVLDEEVAGEYSLHLLEQLLDHGHARIILTNRQENRVRVYDKFTATLSQAADLIALTVINNARGTSSAHESVTENIVTCHI